MLHFIYMDDCSCSLSTGLVNHLRVHFPIMHRLYLALQQRTTPPTEEEINLAHGDVTMDADAVAEYLGKVESATANIIKSFETQAKKVKVCILFVEPYLT